MSVLDRPQLLQTLGLLEGTYRKAGIGKQKLAPVNIKTDVLEMRRATLANIGNRAARKINCVAGQVGDHLDDVRIVYFRRIFDALGQRRHGNIRIAGQRQHGRVDSRRIEQRFIALNIDDHLRVL